MLQTLDKFRSNRLAVRVASIAALVLLLALYAYGVSAQVTLFNNDINITDQGAYANYTRLLIDSNYTFVDGARAPLFMTLHSFFVESDAPPEAIYKHGIVFNSCLSVLLIVVVGVVFFRTFPIAFAIPALLIPSFTVFMFKAGWYQPELLYYTLYFVAFALSLRMLMQPNWLIAVAAGVMFGLAQLTKASLLPMVALFVFFYVLNSLYQAYTEGKRPWLQLAQLCATLLVFVVVISPYARHLKAKFGSYNYNVNSTFYFWYDSWEEVTAGTNAHGDRDGWPDMPEDELPSMSRYLAEHSLFDIAYRFLRGGARLVYHNCYASFGHSRYLVVLGLFLVWAVFNHRAMIIDRVRDRPFVILYPPTLFAAHTVLMAWFIAISGGERHMLPIFLPVLFVCGIAVCLEEIRSKPVSVRGRQYTYWNLLISVLAVMLTVDILLVQPVAVRFISGDG